MNGLVPVLIAVLLAEFGPRAEIYAGARRFGAPLLVIVAGVVAAALAGILVAPTLTDWADAFLIAIALAFAAMGQAQRVKPMTGRASTIMAFWRGGVPLIAFAFATRFGAVTVMAGTLAGLVAAAILTRAAHGNAIPIVPVRWFAVAILAVAAIVVAIGALRLI